VTGAGENWQRTSSIIPDIDKIAFTGSTEVGKRIASSLPLGRRKKIDARALRQGRPTSFLKNAPIDQAGGEGIIAGNLF